MTISIKTPTGSQITVDGDHALIGKDRSCQVALPNEIGLQPIHAKIRKVANRWLIESQGDWNIQVGTGLPARMSWLKAGDVIRLTEEGPEIVFQDTSRASTVEHAVPTSSTPPIEVTPSIVAYNQPPVPVVQQEIAEWFYTKNGQQVGPLTQEQVKQYIATKQIQADDMVWQSGMPSWVKAGELWPISTAIPSVLPPIPKSPSLSPPILASDLILPSQPPKDPILMAVVSFFIPWLGHMLLGQVTKGVSMFLLTPFLYAIFVIATFGLGWVVLPIVNLIAVLDAYLLAKKLKEGQAIGKWEFFGIESARSLKMSEVLLKNGRLSKPRPPGLVGSAIAMLFVSVQGLLMSLLGMIAIIADHSIEAVIQIFIAFSLLSSFGAMVGVYQMLRMKRYALAVLAPILVTGSWTCLTFSGIPIGIGLIGVFSGIAIGIWALDVLRQPEVRAAFENQYNPLEAILPQAKAGAATQSETTKFSSSKGLIRQLMDSKLALGIAGSTFLLLLVVILVLVIKPTQHSFDKFLAPVPNTGKTWLARKTADADDLNEMAGENIKANSGQSVGKNSSHSMNADYQSGYQYGYKMGKEHMKAYNEMNSSGRIEFRKTYLDILARFEKQHREMANNNGDNFIYAQQKKGNADGYRTALSEGGIRP